MAASYSSGLVPAALLKLLVFKGEPSLTTPIVFGRRPRTHFPAGRKGDKTWSMWNSKYSGRSAGATLADGRVRVQFGGRNFNMREVARALLDYVNGGTCSGTTESGGTSNGAVQNGEDEFGYVAEEVGNGPLGSRVREEAAASGLKLADLTAMRADPYRRDMPGGHLNGAWFKQWWERYGR